MKKYQDPSRHKEPITLLDPLDLSSKVNVQKKMIALFYPLGFILAIAGAVLSQHAPAGSLLVLVGTAVSIIGAFLYLIAWLGALANVLQAGRWGWFFALLFLSPIVLLIYIFAGPGPKRRVRNSLFSE